MGLGTMVDSTLHTPNIDSLVGESIVFTNAHANVSGCGPSRASMFSGVLPQTSGHSGYQMSQNSWLDNPFLSQTTSVFKQFLDDGYEVYGGGKVYHAYRLREEDFTEFYSFPTQGPFASNKRNHSDMPESFEEYDLSFARLENVPSYPEHTGWQNRNGSPFFFESDENRDLMADELTVEWCTNLLESYSADSSGNPFFLSAGIYNPHEPFHVPEKYWNLYDTAAFNFEYLQPDTAIPILTAATNRYNSRSNQAYDLMEEESPIEDPKYYLRQFIHGYYASVSFVDEQIGALLDALEVNGLSENTIVILTSDHGFHLGSKGLVAKSTLWNDASSIPFIIKIPGADPQIILDPISLIDLYPTLLDFGNVPAPESHTLEGMPVQEIISGNESGSAILFGISREHLETGELSEVEHSHHALLIGHFKYIHYSSGEDELYDIHSDFRETLDISEQTEFQGIKNSMYRELQRRIGNIRPPVPDYNCLYYGDFKQELNGWAPSEPNDIFGLIETDSLINSRHIFMSGNTSQNIRNENVIFRNEGEHSLMFKAYSSGESADILIQIKSFDRVFLDTVITINSDLNTFTVPFEVLDPLPAFGEPALYFQSGSEFDIHMDDVFIQNVDQRYESLSPCQFAEIIQTDVALAQLEDKSLQLLLNQKPVPCESISGSAPQFWQQFSPELTTGVIAAHILGLNPVIEVFSDCDAQSSICLNQLSGDVEFSYLTDLIPDATYYVRITSDRNVNAFNQDAATVKSIFLNAEPAELSGESVEILNHTSFLELTDQPSFKHSISQVQFRFEELPFGQVFTYNLSLNPSLTYPISEFTHLLGNTKYDVSVSYRLDKLGVDMPLGPKKRIQLQGISSISKFLLFPNPTETNLTTLSLRFNNIETGEGVVSIFDLTGRKIFSQSSSIQSHLLNISGLPSLSQGTYLVAFETINGRSNQELLFVH
jgi:arylsulfatase A-like enzyme